MGATAVRTRRGLMVLLIVAAVLLALRIALPYWGVHYLNGKLCSTVDTNSGEWKECVAQSKFKNKVGFAPGHGKLMLTEHGDPCWFRNIRIKAL